MTGARGVGVSLPQDEMLSMHQPVAAAAAGADHIDVKVFESEATLREFVAGLISYSPWWLTGLFRARGVVVRVLGLEQTQVPDLGGIGPDDVSMAPGDDYAFFAVVAAEEDRFYLAAATESHLTCHLGVVVEEMTGAASRFHLITIVHYHRWTGPVYFNLIRPFHHLVVDRMGRAAATS